jgi:thioredoxin-related protein
VVYFNAYLLTKKCRFELLTERKQKEFIETAFKKDATFKSEIKGLIIGHFTVIEFTIYNSNKSDFNKRILTMILQRIKGVMASL